MKKTIPTPRTKTLEQTASKKFVRIFSLETITIFIIIIFACRVIQLLNIIRQKKYRSYI